jgi:ArsR family transcriptional regulator
MAGDSNARARDASVAVDVLGNPVRTAIFRYVRENPGAVFGDIYDAVRLDIESQTGAPFPQQSLSRHLRTLREADVLATDIPEHLRRGRSPKYTVNEDRAKALVAAFVNSLFPGSRGERPSAQ